VENGGGMSCSAEPVRLDKPPEADQSAAARRRLCGAGPSTARRADRAALLVWENRQGAA